MKHLLFTLLTILLVQLNVFSQELKAKKSRGHFYSEEYNVLADEKKINHGAYSRQSLTGTRKLSGQFDHNRPVGDWTYSENEEAIQTYNYDLQKITFHKKTDIEYSVNTGSGITVLNVDTPPSYIGSKIALAQELSNVIKYPMKAKQMGVEGVVFVEIWVNEDNTLGEIQLIKGIMRECDQEVIAALKKIPGNWIAATINNNQLKASFAIGVEYNLDSMPEVAVR
ncbi:MAG TPA: energy transducer TonB [Cyclobacteriaceae bacterium]|nr:energy transducer TonB [Cyclobacteriaceae bacterium]HMV08107.1 energy transducer TonB [Cyclobacteriaceae bacterium]HMV88321.1 energy transducer TonB [Cyclobacteriaceae bacterium]HMX00748.1 energy transducer TonB [Cyclobacteriaceae bacterium]HMX49377.1 energy transducer TonB [Cyclobacteriaceae bacterium]